MPHDQHKDHRCRVLVTDIPRDPEEVWAQKRVGEGIVEDMV